MSLPPAVVNRVRKNLTAGQSETEQIATVIDSLYWYLDNRIRTYRRDQLIRELGFRVSKGLPSADRAAIANAKRRGVLIPGVSKANQLRVITQSKAARCILERVVLAPITGASAPTSNQLNNFFRIGESLSVFESLLSLAQLAERSQSGASDMPHLGAVAVAVNDDGVEYDYQPGEFDLMRWLQLVERPIGLAEIDFRLFDNGSLVEHGVSPDLEEVSRAMVEDLGFSVEDLLDVLSMLIRLCIEEGYEFLAFDDAAPWPTGVPQAAVDYLTFSDEYLTLENLRPSDTRHQCRRIWTSPLMKHRARHYIFRDIAFEALQRWVRYLTQGDWPVPRNQLRKDCPNLYRALENRSRASGPSFEDHVNSLLEETGLPHSTLRNKARVGAVRLSREIDSVVVDSASRRIHVLEFKNMSSDQNARSLQNELKKFLGEYAEKLKRSVEEVESDKLAFVKRILELDTSRSGSVPIPDNIDSWSVEAAFVFNSHSPIECLTTNQFFTGVNADRIAELFVPGDSES